MPDQAADRRGHAAAVGAEAPELECLEQLLEPRAVDGLVGAEHLVRPAQADPAREALAAALVRAEPQQMPRPRAHVGAVVEGQDATVPEHAALGRERVEVERGVEPGGGQDPAERASDLQRLELAAVDDPAGQLLAQFTHGGAEPDLPNPGGREALVEADELRAGRRP